MTERTELGQTQPAHELPADQKLIGAVERNFDSRIRHKERDFSRLGIMAKVLGAPLVLLAIASACGGEEVRQDTPIANHTPMVGSNCPLIENELIVKFKEFKEGENSAEIQEILDQYDARVIRSDPRLEAWLLEVSSENRDELEEALDQNASVEFAEKNYMGRGTDLPEVFCPTLTGQPYQP